MGERRPLADRVSAGDRRVVERIDDLIAGALGVTVDGGQLPLVGDRQARRHINVGECEFPF